MYVDSLLFISFRLIDAGNGRVLNLRPPFRGTDIKMIKFAICEDMQSKELLPFKRACVPIINSEAVIDYILKVNYSSDFMCVHNETYFRIRCNFLSEVLWLMVFRFIVVLLV